MIRKEKQISKIAKFLSCLNLEEWKYFLDQLYNELYERSKKLQDQYLDTKQAFHALDSWFKEIEK